jgi:hypothetical protein
LPKSVKVMLVATATLLLGPAARASDPAPAGALMRRSTATDVIPPTDTPSTVTIPAATEVSTELLSGIHTQVSHVGDTVTARLSKPLYVNGQIALPPGTLLDGRITRIRAAGRLHRPAELALRFDTIALPDGQARAVQGVLAGFDPPTPFKVRLDTEGYVKGGRAISWKGVAGGLVALSALAIARVPVGGSTAVGSILPASAASLLTYAFVWRRGNEVHLPPETRCRVRLTYPVTVHVRW